MQAKGSLFMLLCAITPAMAFAADVPSTGQDQNIILSQATPAPAKKKSPRKTTRTPKKTTNSHTEQPVSEVPPPPSENTEAEKLPVVEVKPVDAPPPPLITADDRGAFPWTAPKRRGGVKVAVGLRHDKLDFNIAALSGHPNILSELRFDTDMTELRLSGDLTIVKGLVVNGEFSYAGAYSGDVRDSDYSGDHKTNEFSRSYSKTKGSTAAHYSLGTGWRFDPQQIVSLTPMVGYAWTDQTLHIKNGKQTIDTVHGNLGPIYGLNSRYKPEWHGPWVGAQINLYKISHLDLQATAKHQWFRYRAEANWNLRSDFAHPVSYRHTGDGRGWQLGAEAIWNFTRHHAITLGIDWSNERLRDGKNRTFFSDGTTSSTKLNKVNAQSWVGSLGYRFSF